MADYAFTFDRIASDSEGYYHDDWLKAVRVTVVAENQEAAFKALWEMSGTAPRGRFWKGRIVGPVVDARLKAGDPR